MQRQLTLKIITIGVLAILMLIPLTMIESKINERDHYRLEATNSVAQSWTGAQTLMTPFLVIPYVYVEKESSSNNSGFITPERTSTRYKFLKPDQISISGNIVTNTLMRGIYKVPVYESTLGLQGKFHLSTLKKTLEEIKSNEKTRKVLKPFLALNISDPRGINNSPVLEWNNKTISFEPGIDLSMLPEGIQANIETLDLQSDAKFKLSLNLRGMESLSFIPIGDLANIKLNSVWPHPEFIGAFLPQKREVTVDGFKATWQVTQFANNITGKLARCEKGDCLSLSDNSLGVKMIEPVDVYLQSERSVKYGILFIGLSFISFFIFENLKKMRIHPIQYGLVGLSIATFYLLLISLSEHFNFGLSYLIATIACASLIFSYLKFVLAGTKNSLRYCGGLLVLYAVLYIIIQAEDFALLMGAILVFSMLAVVMIVTRHIDWYQIGEQMNLPRNNQPD